MDAGSELFLAHNQYDLAAYVAESDASSIGTASYYGVAVVKSDKCDNGAMFTRDYLEVLRLVLPQYYFPVEKAESRSLPLPCYTPWYCQIWWGCLASKPPHELLCAVAFACACRARASAAQATARLLDGCSLCKSPPPFIGTTFTNGTCLSSHQVHLACCPCEG